MATQRTAHRITALATVALRIGSIIGASVECSVLALDIDDQSIVIECRSEITPVLLARCDMACYTVRSEAYIMPWSDRTWHCYRVYSR